MNNLGPRVHVKNAKALAGFEMEIEFDTGEKRTVDLEPYLTGRIFKPVRENPEIFKRVMIVGGTFAWESGADIDPDVLYYNLQPAWRAEPESR